MCKIVTDEYELELNYLPFEKMTDDELVVFCEQNKELRIERDENRQLSLMPPVFTYISFVNAHLATEVGTWNRNVGAGKAFGSSAGFYLPDTSMRSPDVSWISKERWNALTCEQQKGFAYITPDFVIELVSPSSKWNQFKSRMEMWQRNGVRLGWLINPETEIVFIYRIDGTIGKVEGFDNTLSGEEVLPGFEFRLEVLR